jgi:hypothetical protein
VKVSALLAQDDPQTELPLRKVAVIMHRMPADGMSLRNVAAV